ncbi:MAG TPA: carboxypeptidase-like regulatory domain-containing protein, partial [Bryobacteraceae bacterium]
MRTPCGNWFSAVLFCVSMSVSWGQTAGSGTINGTVRDPNQSVVPDAGVTIHNTGTGVDRVVQTNEVGLYSAPFLPPGNYEVTATKPGFSKLLRKDIVLQVGQTLTLDLALT